MRSRIRSHLVAGAMVWLVVLSGCGDRPDPTAALYRLTVERCSGIDTRRATAVAVGPDLVATVAHSFDRAAAITVEDRSGHQGTARLVYLDPAKDIALIRLTQPPAAVLTIEEPRSGGAVSIATFADSDGPVIKDGTVLDLVDATLDGRGRRAAIQLEADIEPGDSGAPVVDADGSMVGMVFATARGENVGWAISSVEIRHAMDAGGASEVDIPLSC